MPILNATLPNEQIRLPQRNALIVAEELTLMVELPLERLCVTEFAFFRGFISRNQLRELVVHVSTFRAMFQTEPEEFARQFEEAWGKLRRAAIRSCSRDQFDYKKVLMYGRRVSRQESDQYADRYGNVVFAVTHDGVVCNVSTSAMRNSFELSDWSNGEHNFYVMTEASALECIR